MPSEDDSGPRGNGRRKRCQTIRVVFRSAKERPFAEQKATQKDSHSLNWMSQPGLPVIAEGVRFRRTRVENPVNDLAKHNLK